MKKSRFWKHDNKKMDCTAAIFMKEVIKFPDFKVGRKGVVNIQNKFINRKLKEKTIEVYAIA